MDTSGQTSTLVLRWVKHTPEQTVYKYTSYVTVYLHSGRDCEIFLTMAVLFLHHSSYQYSLFTWTHSKTRRRIRYSESVWATAPAGRTECTIYFHPSRFLMINLIPPPRTKHCFHQFFPYQALLSSLRPLVSVHHLLPHRAPTSCGHLLWVATV